MTVIKSDDTEVKRGAVVLLSCVAESFLDAGGGKEFISVSGCFRLSWL